MNRAVFYQIHVFFIINVIARVKIVRYDFCGKDGQIGGKKRRDRDRKLFRRH